MKWALSQHDQSSWWKSITVIDANECSLTHIKKLFLSSKLHHPKNKNSVRESIKKENNENMGTICQWDFESDRLRTCLDNFKQ